MNKVISMPARATVGLSKAPWLRDRRYTIRYPFAADAELTDLESGRQVTGVTSDISLGGCFVCSSKALQLNSRARMVLTRKGQSLQAIVIVRIVKQRVGMGIEFFDLDSPYNEILAAWIDSLRRAR